MSRFILWFVPCFGLFLFALWPLTVPASDPPAKDRQEVEELIHQLGSDSFETREAASRRLMDRADATAALQRAKSSGDVEIVRRATLILDKHALAKLADLAKNGEIDRAVEMLVRRKTCDPESWQVMTDISKTLMEKGQKSFGNPAVPAQNDQFPSGDFKRYVRKADPLVLTANRIGLEDLAAGKKCFVCRGDNIVVEIEIGGSLIVSSGSVRCGGMISSCVIFANGCVESGSIADSVIVCDGTVKAPMFIKNSLIVAHGDVLPTLASSGSWIISTGTIQPPRLTMHQPRVVKQKEKTPLGFVKFFDPASIGVEVESTDNVLRVKTVDAAKSFGRAGLRVGDQVISLDDTKVDSPETFRRALRTKLAIANKFVVKVRREDHALEIPVTCND